MPEFGDSYQNSEYNLWDSRENPGLPTELVTQVNKSLKEWKQYADDSGWVHLCSFDEGEGNVLIRYIEATRKITGRRPLYIEDRFFHRYLRGPSLRPSFYCYSIILNDNGGDTQMQLNATPFAKKDSTKVSGSYTEPFRPLEEPELKNAVQRAINIMRDGLPLSVEKSIAERQNKACEVIVGNEATEVQRVIQRLLPGRDLGNKGGKEENMIFRVQRPTVDGEWSVESVDTHLRRGGVLPLMAGLNGRSVLSFVNFSSETFNRIGERQLSESEFLSVSVEGVYKYGTNDLVGAQVRYLIDGNGGKPEPIAIAPDEREAIFTAINNQVSPDKME